MEILVYLIVIGLSLAHTYFMINTFDFIEYKKPIEEIRRNRIEKLSIQKIQKKNKIYKLRSRQYIDEKKKSKALSIAHNLELDIVQIDYDLNYLNNYGEKGEKEQIDHRSID